MVSKAIILAGGLGTRLGLVDIPKSMADINGVPFLRLQIEHLRDQGIKDFVLCVGHLAEKVREYFEREKGNIRVNIEYSHEKEPLGTGGAIKNAAQYINGTFLLLNGDDFSRVDLEKLIAFHRKHGGIGTVAVKSNLYSKDFGSVKLEEVKIKEFLEKDEKGTGMINSGLYVFEREILNYIPSGRQVSLEKEVFPELAKKGLLNGFVYNGVFFDIGNPERLEEFREYARANL